nr:Hypothetical protein [Raoultella ornithinolytica]
MDGYCNQRKLLFCGSKPKNFFHLFLCPYRFGNGQIYITAIGCTIWQNHQANYFFPGLETSNRSPLLFTV